MIHTIKNREGRLAALDVKRAKAGIVAMWQRGAGDTPVKVTARDRPLKDATGIPQASGYISTIKFLVGRTPREMEDVLGLGVNKYNGRRVLDSGANIYILTRPPRIDEFELRGHTHMPDGRFTNDTDYAPKPEDARMYPPGLGAPQWQISSSVTVPARLIASLSAGEMFRYPLPTLAYRH